MELEAIGLWEISGVRRNVSCVRNPWVVSNVSVVKHVCVLSHKLQIKPCNIVQEISNKGYRLWNCPLPEIFHKPSMFFRYHLFLMVLPLWNVGLYWFKGLPLMQSQGRGMVRFNGWSLHMIRASLLLLFYRIGTQ